MRLLRFVFLVLAFFAVGHSRAQEVNDDLPADAGLSDKDRVLAHDLTVRRKVTTDEAVWLAVKALGGGRKRWEYMDNPNPVSSPPFVSVAQLGLSAGVNGFYLVNPWTGRVWDEYHCQWLSTPALERARVKIRTRFTANELQQYDALDKIQPPCEYP